jgi:cytochrome c
MKTLMIGIMCMITTGLLVTSAFAGGDIEKGKALFNDTTFAGATSGNSCNTCHPNGSGLENAGDKKEFNIMGKKQNSLEEAVNVCIVMAIKGKAIDTMSNQMKDIVAYIKSLKGKS